jgi:hypothetical protein
MDNVHENEVFQNKMGCMTIELKQIKTLFISFII